MFKKRVALFLIPVMLAATVAFAFTRDWDESDPIDHSKNNTWPAEIREVMADVAERLTYLYGFASGETAVGAKRIPFEVQGSDPGATANQIKCYSKDDAGKAELFCQDEDTNVIQITSAGAFAAAASCSAVYPVGSIYISTVSTDPGTLLGCGTWAAFGAGKVLVGLDSGDGDFDTSEETGGAKTHDHGGTTDTGSSNDLAQDGSNLTIPHENHTHVVPSDSLVQPYIVVYMFKRTA